MKQVLVCGAGGFIGVHLVRALAAEGCWVRGVDQVVPGYGPSAAHEFLSGDLRDRAFCEHVVDRPYDEVYQLAADMGGAGYIFTHAHDAEIMRNSLLINLNMVEACHQQHVGRVFFSSSACVYPAANQTDPAQPNCAEDSVYPANPDSEYGWEKLISERLYLSYQRQYNLDVRIARYHTVYGPEGTWQGGREKAVAALCRKVIVAPVNGVMDIWGDGLQTRSFIHVDDCVAGTLRLMRSSVVQPLNIGSDELISIDALAAMIMAIAHKPLTVRHIAGPVGVRGRCSDNRLSWQLLNWRPRRPFILGLAQTYRWIEQQLSIP